MREFDLRKLQLCELQMLKDVVKMCDDNNIAYFLDAGTLLGTVRHGGFIPWDDDIDIGMDTENYKKFCKIAPKKLDKRYFVQNYKTDRKVGISWSRVRINGTTSMERDLIGYDIHQGICMDVFEYVGIPNGIRKEIAKRANKLKYLFLVKYYIEAKGETMSPKLSLFYKLMPENVRIKVIDLLKKMSGLRTNKAEYCYNSWYSSFEDLNTVILPSRLIDASKRIRMKFEDEMFWVPQEYEKLLELMYDNWKKLPLEEERNGHGNIIVDLERDYKTYYEKI